MTPRRTRRVIWRLLGDAARAEHRWLRHPSGRALGPLGQPTLRRFADLIGLPWSAHARPNVVQRSFLIDPARPPRAPNLRPVLLGAYRDGVPAQRAAAVRGTCLAPRPPVFRLTDVTHADLPVLRPASGCTVRS